MTDTHGAQIMEGTVLARKILSHAARRALAFESLTKRAPCLAAVLVGNDPSSETYVKMKRRRCQDAGVRLHFVALPAQSTTSEVIEVLRSLSEDPDVDGILLQHPVPRHIDERAAFEAIHPGKDVDGVTMHSFAAMAFGLPGFPSCTPAGIIRLLDENGIEPTGMNAVVVGRSPILGMPMGMLLLARNATVTYCHSHTRDLSEIVRTADLVIAAVGRPRFIRGHWLKPGAVVIDAGYTGGSVGDVAFDEARTVAGFVTPVPGGVGPMTIAMLVEQTVRAAEESYAITRRQR